MKTYQFRQFSKLNLTNAQKLLTAHAAKVGLYENFGQEVVRYLKDKYGYPYDCSKEVLYRLESLNEWCSRYDGK